MTPSFRPPNLDRLTEVDSADCEYAPEPVDIQGVVSPSSQGGWPARDEYEVHTFSFAAWRRIGGRVIERELTILRPVASAADSFSDYPEYTIHRLQVLLSIDEERALLVKPIKLDGDDPELLAISTELQKPVVISTSRFGDLTLDRSVNCFHGESTWNGRPVGLIFFSDQQGDISASLSAAEALWNAQADWKRKVDDYAVQELLQLKNDNWLEDGEPLVTAAQFKSRMVVQSISVSPDARFSFWHDDGDLFWGHAIAIEGSLTRGLVSADIPG